MKRFLRNVLLFLSPILAVVFFLVIPMYIVSERSGELKPIEENIEKQRDNHSILVGLGYNEQTPAYKLLNVNYYKPEIVALGTSRVMQFEKQFFGKSFYNCGGAVGGNYSEYRNFLKNLTYTPNVVIIGLDAWVFNHAWNQSQPMYNDLQKITVDDRGTIALLKSIAIDWFSGQWSVSDLDNYSDNIGFNGRVKDSGFVYDGSYYYGDIYRNPASSNDYGFKDTMGRIENGVLRFEWGDCIDLNTIEQLRGLLQYCKEKGIEAVGVLTPFAPSIYKKMNECGKYGYINQISPKCKSEFEKLGFEYYDFCDGAVLGMEDCYYIDGFHGSELVYGRILEKMVSSRSILNDYVDSDKIKQLMEGAYSSLTFINPDEWNEWIDGE